MHCFPDLEPVHCSMSSSVASWPAYRFLRRQVWQSGISISLRTFQFVVIYTVRDFSVVNEEYINGCLEFSCFFYDPAAVGNLISGSSFLNPAWTPGISQFTYCRSLAWRILSINSVACESSANCAVVWVFFGFAFLWDWNENWPFPVLWALLSFPNLLAYWVQQFHSIIF